MIFLSTLIKASLLLASLIGLSTTGYLYYHHKASSNSLNSEYDRPQYQHHHHQLHAQTQWAPIKVITDFTNANMSPAQLKFLQDRLLNPTLSFLKTTLNVKTRTQKTVFISRCGNFNVPQSIRSSTSPFDLGIIVAGVNAKGQSWWMRGVSCELDSITNRPVLGTLEINLAHFTTINLQQDVNEQWKYWYQQTMREIIHLTVFNSVLYDYYIDPATNVKLGRANVVRDFFKRQYITLKPVLERVKRHFGCNNAIGGLLEDNGGPDVAGFHWERVTFGNEIMTGDQFPDQIVSEFTLALFEGSGWYQVNYNYAQPFVWGLNSGCLLTQGNCGSTYDEFCKSETQIGCSTDFKAIGGCYTNDQLAKGCGYWREQTDCRYSDLFANNLAQKIGGRVGFGSACFLSNLPSQVGLPNIKSGCFSTQCDGSKLKFLVGANTYACERESQNVIVEYQSIRGIVSCPNPEKFCAGYSGCQNDCSGQGTCKGKACSCWQGYTGSDCSIRVQ